MCVYSYHAWWRSNKIRINFLTRTESEKIKRINEGTLTFVLKNVPFGNGSCNGDFHYRQAVYEPPG